MIHDNALCKYASGLTFFYDQITHDERHGVSGVNIISAIHVFAVDGQPESRQEFEDPKEDVVGRRVVRLGLTHVMLVGLWQNGDVHRDSTVIVVNADQEEYPPQHNAPANKYQ